MTLAPDGRPAPIRAHAHAPAAPALGAARAPTVLVVDDEPDILDSLADLLRGAIDRVDVVTAASGADALRVMGERRVDLIVTDYKMPGMNGLEFLSQARRAAPRVPRILVTAFPDLEIALKALNSEGIDHFFTKPLDPVHVLRGVRQVLGRAGEEAQAGRTLAAGFGARPPGAARPGSSADGR